MSRDQFERMVVDLESAEKLKQEYSEFAYREERKENSLMAFFFGGSIVGGAAVFLLMGGANR